MGASASVLNVASQQDINQARVFAGLPPETANESFRYYTTPHPSNDSPTN